MFKSPVICSAIKAFQAFLFVSAVFFIAGKAAYAFEISELRFGQHPDKTRLVIEMTAERDFRAFMLSNPYRMVVDMPEFQWRAPRPDDLVKYNMTGIRQGNLKPGISRIVLDMNAPIEIMNAFTLPRNANNPPRLVVDYKRVNVSAFQRARANVFGELDVENVRFVRAAPSVPAPVQKPADRSPSPKVEKPLIIIDPGHGGVDPGAIGANGVHEKRVALALALELKKQLEASGDYRVKMTRETDVFIKLGDRVRFARRHSGDLFVSIHADSLRDSSVTGASVYTLSEKASDEQTARLAARENRADMIAGIDIEVEDEAVMDILIDLARRNTQNQSKYFANTLVDTFGGSGIKLLRRPHRFANFAVLKAPEIPSVLVEAGFMSNKREANKLNTASHRQKIARALRKSIDSYFDTVLDRHSG